MRSETITLFSPAKINLTFQVLGQRDDGYHEISSRYQAISLGDTLEVCLADRSSLTCSGLQISLEQNLIIKAFNLFKAKTGWQGSVAFRLEKRIPLQSGLGGGSSNAATVLWALNALSGCCVAESDLALWSTALGSDVPFFFSSGSAYCSGRGEQVVDEKNPYLSGTFWIAKPKEGLSTAAVYASYARHSFVFQKVESEYSNDLEQAAFHIMPSLKLLKAQLVELGFGHVVMTGSGSAFFCLPSSCLETKALSKDALFEKTEELDGAVIRSFASLSRRLNVDVYPVHCIKRKPGCWYECENI